MLHNETAEWKWKFLHFEIRWVSQYLPWLVESEIYIFLQQKPILLKMLVRLDGNTRSKRMLDETNMKNDHEALNC